MQPNFGIPETKIKLSDQVKIPENLQPDSLSLSENEEHHNKPHIVMSKFNINLKEKKNPVNFRVLENQVLSLKKKKLELFIEDESCQICNSVEFTQINHIVFCAVT